MLVIGGTFSIAFFNFFGISVTKFASAAQRSTIDSLRTLFIWMFFLFQPSDKPYREIFYWEQLIGFIILVFGTLVYNEIVVLPFCGFNLWTKDAIAERERQGLLDG